MMNLFQQHNQLDSLIYRSQIGVISDFITGCDGGECV